MVTRGKMPLRSGDEMRQLLKSIDELSDADSALFASRRAEFPRGVGKRARPGQTTPCCLNQASIRCQPSLACCGR